MTVWARLCYGYTRGGGGCEGLGTQMSETQRQRRAASRPAPKPKSKVQAKKAPVRVPNVVRRNRSHGAVLDAAERLFVRKGYNSTTVDEIATEAGLTKGAIYFHFADKNNVLMALIDRAEQRVIAPLIGKLTAGHQRPGDKLIVYLHYWAQVGIEQRETMFLPILMSLEFTGTGDQIEKRLTRMYERIYEVLTAIIAKGHQDGSIRKQAAPREQAAILIAMMEGMLLEWLRRTDSINGPAIVRAMRAMLLTGSVTPK